MRLCLSVPPEPKNIFSGCLEHTWKVINWIIVNSKEGGIGAFTEGSGSGTCGSVIAKMSWGILKVNKGLIAQMVLLRALPRSKCLKGNSQRKLAGI